MAWFEACLAWQGYNDNRSISFLSASQKCMISLLYGTDFASSEGSIVWSWIDALLSGGMHRVGARAVAALLQSEWSMNLRHVTPSSSCGAILSKCAESCCLGSDSTRRAGYTFVTLTLLHHWHEIYKRKIPCGSKILLAGSINSGYVGCASVRARGFELLKLGARLLFGEACNDIENHHGSIVADFELTLCQVEEACKMQTLAHSWTSVANATSESVSSAERFVLSSQKEAINSVIQQLSSSLLPEIAVGAFAIDMVKQAVHYLCAGDSECSLLCNAPKSSSILRAVRFVRGTIVPWITLAQDVQIQKIIRRMPLGKQKSIYICRFWKCQLQCWKCVTHSIGCHGT